MTHDMREIRVSGFGARGYRIFWYVKYGLSTVHAGRLRTLCGYVHAVYLGQNVQRNST